MHPLRHPRNAALVGIIFIVIAFIYWVVPTVAGLTVPYDMVAAGTTMLLFLGRRDGDHGLRPRRRVVGRVTRAVPARTT